MYVCTYVYMYVCMHDVCMYVVCVSVCGVYLNVTCDKSNPYSFSKDCQVVLGPFFLFLKLHNMRVEHCVSA